MKSQLNIKDTPTLVFIRNGNEIDRIDDLDESNPNIDNSNNIKEESVDEQRVIQKLNDLCKNKG